MSTAQGIVDAPFGSRRGLLLTLVAIALVLGALVWVDVLPRLDPPPPKVEGTPFLPPGVESATSVHIVRGRKNFRLEKVGTGWEMIDQGKRFPLADERADEFLGEIGGLVQLLQIGPASEVDRAEFGLSQPRDRIILGWPDGREIQILLGDRNPPLTGIYVEVMPGGDVVLVGAVLLLEMDKLAALASAQATSNPSKESGSALDGGPR